MRTFGSTMENIQCARCGTPMTIITGMFTNRALAMKVQGCFQCMSCGEYTCYDCSDNREPCECGAKQWIEKIYVGVQNFPEGKVNMPSRVTPREKTRVPDSDNTNQLSKANMPSSVLPREKTEDTMSSILQNVQKLSEGIPNMGEKRMTRREKIGDTIYLNLQFCSHFLFFITSLLGYYFYGIYGVFFGGITGWVIGIWMRHSMGIRADPTTGFFVRMRERAQGARRGMLEWLLEKIRGNEFSRSKCQAISEAYDQAMNELNQCTSPEEQKEIIIRLDTKVKEISYGR